MLLQRVQDGTGISVFKAAVEGEVDDFFFGLFHEGGVISGQFFRGGISHRRLPFLLKAQPPVVGYR